MKDKALAVLKRITSVRVNKFALTPLIAAGMGAAAQAVDSTNPFVIDAKTKIGNLSTDTSEVAVAAIAIIAVIALFYLIKGFFYAK